MLCAGMDRETGRSKGFAHVQFEDVAGAAAAIALSGSELEGRELFIDSAKERPASGNTPNSNRGKTQHSLWTTACLSVIGESDKSSLHRPSIP